ncbi:hypothetical protein SD80_024360 [Scytonema tolypothrichoides VB-61278]|nr:hypothetical protein SD80_024360 [Scytonema tolypothrichoides VB-61278]
MLYFRRRVLADLIPHAQLKWLKSIHGHDGFLIDMTALNELVIFFRQDLDVDTEKDTSTG